MHRVKVLFPVGGLKCKQNKSSLYSVNNQQVVNLLHAGDEYQSLVIGLQKPLLRRGIGDDIQTVN